jgi:O-antigen chain-terminating methyltransferase
MTDAFYRLFEERFRGSREVIKQRLRVYLPFVVPLMSSGDPGEAVDLGCGRGEWLELMQDEGLPARGVDADAGMLEACVTRGLRVTQGDALAWLAQQGDAQFWVVSAFHVAEHLPFDELRRLVHEAMRVLKPGGLLVLETPNPENLGVATRHFYLDPTHRNPIPPELLSFLTEYAGFSRVKLLRLQEPERLYGNVRPALRQLLDGVSPDYAVVAQKAGPEAVLSLNDAPFQRSHGISIDDMVGHWDAGQEAAESRWDRAEQQTQELFEQVQEIRAVQAHLDGLLNSKSWRMTAPLRWVFEQGRRLREHGLMARTKALAKKLLRRADKELSQRPLWRARLKSMMRRLGLLESLSQAARRVQGPIQAAAQPITPPTRRALEIHQELCAGIDALRREKD